MMGHREELKGGDEFDAVYGKRPTYYCYLKRPRVKHNIKKKMSRRARRELKKELKDE